MKNLFVFCGLIALLTACNPSYTRFLQQEQLTKIYSRKYSDYIDEDSELIAAGYNWTSERKPDGTVIKRTFQPDKEQITEYISFDGEQKSGTYKRWYDNGALWEEGQLENGMRVGEWKTYNFPDGKLEDYGTYQSNEQVGTWTRVDSTGKKLSTTTYSKGKRNGAYKIWNANGQLMEEGRYENDVKVDSTIFKNSYISPSSDDSPFTTMVEEMPYLAICATVKDKKERQECSTKQLLESLYRDLKYPASARENGLEGTAILQFTVKKDGTLTDIDILRGLSNDIAAACLDAVRTLPAWEPGRQHGKPVNVRFTLPMKFKLQ